MVGLEEEEEAAVADSEAVVDVAVDSEAEVVEVADSVEEVAAAAVVVVKAGRPHSTKIPIENFIKSPQIFINKL